MKRKINDLTPSVFTDYPWDSVTNKCEAETVAQNIMIIRERLGDKWKITYKEYEAERKLDGEFSDVEKYYFDKVIKAIPDAISAIAFSPTWAKAARKAVKRV